NQILFSIILSNGHIYNVDDVKDPIACKDKGRPPNQQLKAFNKECQASNSKTQQVSIDYVDSENSANKRKCRLCHKTGHYAPRCSNKENKQM
ncbi:35706_t:CDS:1, partial [Gigaspora margarita]